MTTDTRQAVVLLGLARNCEQGVEALLHLVVRLRTDGLNVEAVIGENGSTDRTRIVLEQGAESGLCEVVDTSSMSSVSDRLKRMAAGRELVLQHALKSLGPNTIVGVVDLDEPFSEALSAQAFLDAASILKIDGSVMAVSATSEPFYYDLLAYEDDETSFRSIPGRLNEVPSWRLVRKYRLHKKLIFDKQVDLTRRGSWDTRSAFNGVAVYRGADYARASYVSTAEVVPCEHIVFHQSLRDRCGLDVVRVSSVIVVPTPPEHGPVNFFKYAWDRIRRWSRSFA